MLDEDFAELLLEPLPLVEDDDEGTLLEEAIFTLLLDLDEISSSFELLAEIDESLPQAENPTHTNAISAMVIQLNNFFCIIVIIS